MASSSPRNPGRRPAARQPGDGAAAAGRPRRRPEPEGFEPAELNSSPPTPPAKGQPRRRPAHRPGTSIPGAPAILTDLLRAPLQMVGQMTGIDTAARAMERLAVSADRAASLLDRIDEEVGVERIINVLERLERLSETADQMNRSLRAIERLALDVQKRIIEPLDRLPIPRALREGLGGGSGHKPER